jgi:hypothetical protein
MKKSVPNLPASSRLQPPAGGGGPSIKNPMKAKPLTMSGGVPSKSANSAIKAGGVASIVKKAKK